VRKLCVSLCVHARLRGADAPRGPQAREAEAVRLRQAWVVQADDSAAQSAAEALNRERVQEAEKAKCAGV